MLPMMTFQRYQYHYSQWHSIMSMAMRMVHISSGYSFFYSFEESQRGTLFTVSVNSMNIFIAQSFTQLSKRDRSVVKPPNGNAMVYWFALKRTELTKRFHGVCDQVIHNSTMVASNAFWNLLGYDRIFAAHFKDSDQYFDHSRFAQVEQYYGNLHVVDENWDKGTSWWLRAHIEDNLATPVNNSVHSSVAVQGVDLLLKLREVRMTLSLFNRYDISEKGRGKFMFSYHTVVDH